MRIASFDVFDTVLVRTVAEPHDLFGRIGNRLAAALPRTPAGPQFAALRRHSEQEARRRAGHREIVLNDILEVLGATLGWSEEERRLAREAELAVETESIRAIPSAQELIATARRAGVRLVFISDMYLPSAAVRGWLEREGCWRLGDRLYISGEAGAAKHSGALYELIQRELGCAYRDWIHCGDHPVSDYQRPLALGITARLCEAGRLSARERRLRGGEPLATDWRAQLAGAARLGRLDQPAYTLTDPVATARWTLGTGVAAPIFLGFVAWCLAEARRYGLTDLFFAARAGQILLKVASALPAEHTHGVRLHYLPVSRLAVAGCAFIDQPERLRGLVASTLAFQSARQAFAAIGLASDVPTAPPWLPRPDWERNLAPTERARLADWLLAPERLPRVQAALRARSESARQFFEHQQLAGNDQVGFVDTGWTGTIQHHLEFILGTAGRPAPVTGFYFGLNTPTAPCAGPMHVYETSLSKRPAQSVDTPRILLELMAQADHGQVLNYARGSGGWFEPQLGPQPAAHAAEIHFFQQAVMATVRHFVAEGADALAAPPEQVAQVVMPAFLNFCRHPTRAEALAFGRIRHSDQVLEQQYTELCPPFTPREVAAAILNRRRRPPAWWLEGQAAIGSVPLAKPFLAWRRWKWFLQGFGRQP